MHLTQSSKFRAFHSKNLARRSRRPEAQFGHRSPRARRQRPSVVNSRRDKSRSKAS